MEKTKLINFENWCSKCEYRDTKDIADPCNECLNFGASEDGVPVKFKMKGGDASWRNTHRKV